MNFLKTQTLFIKDEIWKYGIVLILIYFVANTLTGIFFNYSIPNTIGDEMALMAATLKMIAEPSLRPDYPLLYHVPFATYIYLPFFVALLVFLRLSGLFTSMEELKAFGSVHYAELLPMARFISVLLGAVSVYLVYKICQKLFNNKFISLTASFLLSTNLMFVYLSHFGRIWVPQIFVILLTFYFIASLYQKHQAQFRDYFKIAFLIGISLGTHLVGILVYLPFLVVHYLKNRSRGLKEIFIINRVFWLSNLTIAALLFLAYYLNPYGFINYTGKVTSSLGRVLTEGVGSIDSGSSVNLWKGLSFYGQVLFEYGPILSILFILSLIPLFFKNRNLFFIFGSFIFGYYFVMGSLIGNIFALLRFISPIIPFMAIVSAYGIYYFYKSNFANKKIRIIVLFILLSSFLYAPPLLGYKLIQPSSIASAQKWIYNDLPQGSKIINFYHYFPINENRETIEDIKQYNPKFFTSKRKYLSSTDNAHYPKPNYYVLTPAYYKEDIPEEILNQKFDYALAGWWNEGDYFKFLKASEPFGLKEENLVKIFPSGAAPDTFSMNTENMRHPFRNLRKMNHIGPIMAIYKLK